MKKIIGLLAAFVSVNTFAQYEVRVPLSSTTNFTQTQAPDGSESGLPVLPPEPTTAENCDDISLTMPVFASGYPKLDLLPNGNYDLTVRYAHSNGLATYDEAVSGATYYKMVSYNVIFTDPKQAPQSKNTLADMDEVFSNIAANTSIRIENRALVYKNTGAICKNTGLVQAYSKTL